ncbi:unnamed protein product [Rhizoctonia solani]|uniref:Uncharacterized protein n=1 Tax=Rhizoctonia solani TaxID=456999 RepID=A0A8H2W4S0_9AGAM|nr:unnamed protein product [Rhizoctonia solani]
MVMIDQSVTHIEGQPGTAPQPRLCHGLYLQGLPYFMTPIRDLTLCATSDALITPPKLAIVVEEEDANVMGSTRSVEHGHECTWSQEEDARRPATKQLVESLRVRIRELESELSHLRTAHLNAETARASVVPSSASSDGGVVQPDPQSEFPGQSHLTASGLHQVDARGFVTYVIDRCKKGTLAPAAPHPCGRLFLQMICHLHSALHLTFTLTNSSFNATQIFLLIFNPVPPNFLTNANGAAIYV